MAHNGTGVLRGATSPGASYKSVASLLICALISAVLMQIGTPSSGAQDGPSASADAAISVEDAAQFDTSARLDSVPPPAPETLATAADRPGVDPVSADGPAGTAGTSAPGASMKALGDAGQAMSPESTDAQPAAAMSVATSTPAPPIGVSFDGLGQAANRLFGTPVTPPDTVGAVGPNHYVQMVNKTLAVFDKTGSMLLGPLHESAPWSGFGGPCEYETAGDPIVIYDQLADRWLISLMADESTAYGPYWICAAVSTTPDPTGSFHRYAFRFDDIPDYPKWAVWPDGYYLTVNRYVGGMGGGDFTGSTVAAFERDRMLAGLTARMVRHDTGTDWTPPIPASLDGFRLPPPGSPHYGLYATWSPDGCQYAGWCGLTNIGKYKFSVDWDNPAASTFTTTPVIPLPGTTANPVSQPDPYFDVFRPLRRLDSIWDRLLFRASYRNLGDHESLVASYVGANTPAPDDRSGTATAAWFEIRDPASASSSYQGGVQAPDGDARWMGSAAMDHSGNLALGYSVAGTSTMPSIRYAGRLAGDPPNQLGQEGTIVQGSGWQRGTSGRWGDYSTMTVDPVDDCTFWYTNQYYTATSALDWNTRIASFGFPECSPAPAPPQPAFTVSGSGPSPRTATFDASATTASAPATFEWDFGDGSGGTGPTPSHVYSQPGAYAASLKVTDANGLTRTETEQVIVESPTNQAPTAAFTAFAPNQNVTNGALHVSAEGSSDSDGVVQSHQWDFGDATTASGPTAVHMYAAPGPKTVTLTVTDNQGASSSTSQTIQVLGTTNAAPTGSLNVAPLYVPGADVLVVSVADESPDVIRRRFDCDGDGIYEDQNRQRSQGTLCFYPGPGTYTLKVQLGDEGNAKTMLSQQVDVGPVQSRWHPAGTMASPRLLGGQTVLDDGSVLVFGGMTSLFGGDSACMDSVERWSPTQGWQTEAPLPDDLCFGVGVKLADGSVLVAGGVGTGFAPLDTVVRFDGSGWATLAPLPEPSYEAALLTTGPNAGKVLVAGVSQGPLAYDPTSGTTLPLAEPPVGSSVGGAAVTLPDGTLLFPSTAADTGLFYDPVADTWETLTWPNGSLINTATSLPDGRVFALTADGSVLLYDRSTDTWTTGAPTQPNISLYDARSAALPDGRVLVVGVPDALTSQVYDPADDTWSTPEPMQAPHAPMWSGLPVLPDGRVFVVGGSYGDMNSVTLHGIAEVYGDAPSGGHAPELAVVGDQVSSEGETVSVDVSATDADGDVLSFSATGLPAGLGIDTGTGKISGTLGYSAAGTYPVTVNVTDGVLSDSEALTWTVTDVNRPPVATVDTVTPSSGTIPLAVSFVGSGSDTDGTVTGYSWNFGDGTPADTSGPAVSHTYTASGTYQVTLTVTDDDGSFGASAPVAVVALDPTITGDQIEVAITGGLTYANSKTLTSGNYTISKDGRGITSVSGSGTFPSAISGDAQVAVSVSRVWILPTYLGTMRVSDPAAGISLTHSIFFGRVTATGAHGATNTQNWRDFAHFPWKPYTLTWTIQDLP